MKAIISKLIKHIDLSIEEAEQATEFLLESPNIAQISAFLVLLRAKGETANEVFGMVNVFRHYGHSLTLDYPVLDIVGTGGDGANTINISTCSALLAACCGVKIAKHGNKSVSSLCGAADLMEALNLPLHQTVNAVKKDIDKHNFGFFFAPYFHPALKKLKAIRTDLAVATTCNILGPLLNPAKAQYLMIGVFDKPTMALVANIIHMHNPKHALIFCCMGMDEICTAGLIEAIEIKNGTKLEITIDPQDYGFSICSKESLLGGSPKANAKRTRDIFQGTQDGATDSIILNAGIATYIYGLTPSIREGISLAKQRLFQGDVMHLLEKLQNRPA